MNRSTRPGPCGAPAVELSREAEAPDLRTADQRQAPSPSPAPRTIMRPAGPTNPPTPQLVREESPLSEASGRADHAHRPARPIGTTAASPLIASARRAKVPRALKSLDPERDARGAGNGSKEDSPASRAPAAQAISISPAISSALRGPDHPRKPVLWSSVQRAASRQAPASTRASLSGWTSRIGGGLDPDSAAELSAPLVPSGDSPRTSQQAVRRTDLTARAAAVSAPRVARGPAHRQSSRTICRAVRMAAPRVDGPVMPHKCDPIVFSLFRSRRIPIRLGLFARRARLRSRLHRVRSRPRRARLRSKPAQ